MTTPICDFVKAYAGTDTARFHMPGHKGQAFLGCEPYDITEIRGADELYAPRGIIRESEENAARLFGAGRTLYSAEGATLCIKAMLFAVLQQSRPHGARPLILAGRNAHKAFLYAAALLDFDVQWLYGQASGGLCRCTITPSQLGQALQRAEQRPAAVYITSPDYLGGTSDIGGLAAVCHESGIPLLVDNAHGAYLRFLEQDRHPLALGADLCCDSAHKTLPVLTGGAYLHLAKGQSAHLEEAAQEGMSLFGSTSPSYLILQSLDLCNRLLASTYPAALRKCVLRVAEIKAALSRRGLRDSAEEPLKLALSAQSLAMTGMEAAAFLRENGMECEYADRDHMVLMFTPQNQERDYQRLLLAMESLPANRKAPDLPPPMACGLPAMGIRQALLAPQERIPAREAVGRICAAPTVSCPPAVPVAVSGERITEEVRDLLLYYGVEEVSVTVES